MMVFANQKVQYWWVPQTHQCVTNADFRLANWQVNDVNIVLKCYSLLNGLVYGKGIW